MARPRVFVSSTYYDLKHIRSSLDNFIDSLGFEAVLSEKGDIAYSPDLPLDESCYREAQHADILVLIIGGRYGSAATGEEKHPSDEFLGRYDSITKKEYQSAVDRDIPTYILVEADVYSEYQTYLCNRDNRTVEYAHVDSINIFRLLGEVLSKPRNNPVHAFERSADIEAWLRQQWSGLFQKLLQRMTRQQQIATLSDQVQALSAINETLQRYLETVMSKVSPDEAPELIEAERKRRDDLAQIRDIVASDFYQSVYHAAGLAIRPEELRGILLGARSVEDLAGGIARSCGDPDLGASILGWLKFEEARIGLRQLCRIVGREEFYRPLPDRDAVRSE